MRSLTKEEQAEFAALTEKHNPTRPIDERARRWAKAWKEAAWCLERACTFYGRELKASQARVAELEQDGKMVLSMWDTGTKRQVQLAIYNFRATLNRESDHE